MLTSIYKRKGRAGVTLAYDDPLTGRLRQKQFRTRAEAVTFRDEVRRHPTMPQAALGMTFHEYAARWLRATRTAVRAGTYHVYESIVRVHLAPTFRGQLHEITRSEIRDLVVRLRESGLRKNTINNVRATLHAILETAVEEGLLQANPAHFRSRSRLMRLTASSSERRATVKALTIDQARAFFVEAAVAAPRHAVVWRVMVGMGLRSGEALGLQVGDIDYRAAQVKLARSVTRGRVEPCKTNAAGEFDYVDLPAGLAAELRTWETRAAKEALAAGRPRPRWLFPRNGADEPMDDREVAVAFKRTMRRAGLPAHFSPHSLRHTYATHQLAYGESIYYVSRQLRHSDIRMTVGTYGSWLPAGNRKAADRHYERLLGRVVTRHMRRKA